MLEFLKVLHLRILERVELELGAGMNLFVGRNAQGKTSLLEAVCLLLRLSSPRTGRLSECIAYEQEGLSVSGELAGCGQRVVLRGKERVLEREGVKLHSAMEYLAGSQLLVWMGNEDLHLVRAAAAQRRRYLDFLGGQLLGGYREARRGFERARAQRNRLLREGESGQLLEAFTQEFLRYGGQLMLLRSELVERLRGPVQEAMVQLSAQAAEEVELVYEAGARADFAAHLQEKAQAEARRGMSLVGPHRDELRLFINGKKAADFASEGQQRSLAIALKLAQGKLLEQCAGQSPLWLVDDVFSELDLQRREALIGQLQLCPQLLVATTSLGWMKELGLAQYRLFEVEQGRVKQAERLD